MSHLGGSYGLDLRQTGGVGVLEHRHATAVDPAL
jgi:hypothetical protein